MKKVKEIIRVENFVVLDGVQFVRTVRTDFQLDEKVISWRMRTPSGNYSKCYDQANTLESAWQIMNLAEGK